MPESAAQPANPITLAHAPAGSYRVLARTYRPQRLSELVGQDALVRTLGNAIGSGRVAHAFLLTGIRGVGKTTTARIIARALNCIGPDGQGEPTPEPCGECEHCIAIAESRHIDVLEMDAATRTGIDDIRELVDSVRYAPTSARNKVYIVDEVHMLSEKAFNGLLKTLEEPPPKTVFIFATTEVRKIPVTVLSRCQRFDLRRVEGEQLSRHLGIIAATEKVAIDAAALALITRAAEGSIRDGLSLLDQAIALVGGTNAVTIDAAQIQDMLGLADRGQVLDLFEKIMAGDVATALDRLGDFHDHGSEPEVVVQDLLDICHWLTRLKIAPDVPGGATWNHARGVAMAERLGMPVLARTWQMLLKGLDDLRLAPSPMLAAEMLLVRLAYAAELPSPVELARLMAPAAPAAPGESAGGTGPTEALAASAEASAAQTEAPAAPGESASGTGLAEAPAAPSLSASGAGLAEAPARHDLAPAAPESFAAAVALFELHDKPVLRSWLHDQARLVRFEPGKIELEQGGHVPGHWRQDAAECLIRWTNRPWQITFTDSPGEPSLAEQADGQKRARIEALTDDPRVKPVLEAFPGAEVVDVRATDPSSLDHRAERP